MLETKAFNKRDSLFPSSANTSNQGVDVFGVIGIVIAAIAATAGILALFKGWKCWKRRRITVNPPEKHSTVRSVHLLYRYLLLLFGG